MKFCTLRRWFDSYSDHAQADSAAAHKIDWLRTIPFIALHLSVLFVLVVGWSPIALGIAIGLYCLRMFAITGFYHRYFSHKAFRTSRFMQFLFAVIGASAVQRGPLWWAAHHRLHHVNADKDNDEHSPRQHGFFWSHMGWFLSRHNFATRLDKIQDFARYPELRFLDRFDVLIPTLLAVSLFVLGETLAYLTPEAGTNGWQLVVWGFVISTVVLYHITFTINSLAHSFGHRRFDTRDDSRNNPLLAVLTFGEGWHNNHHFYPGSARQGFAWWEFDITYYLLRLLQALGLIWDLRPVPDRVLQQRSRTRLKHTARAVS
ncbi:MAG: acyl-CoA desaturase [Gammaproteobacteria bacterium]|nr:acyl-CoA desaturase [Gammaproteobacteria bacterium]